MAVALRAGIDLFWSLKDAMEQILSLRSKFEGYMDFDENLETLKAEVDQLHMEANDMEAKLKNLERGGQRKRKQGVEGWLQQVNKLETNFETFKESIQGAGFIMKNARKLIKAQELEGMTERVKKLREEGRSNTVEPTLDVSTSYELNVDQLFGTASKINLVEIYRWVEDANVTSIGVYGMGGVGKTTLAQHLYNKICKENPRANVYWVTVSQDFNIRKLQDNIARSAGIGFSDVDNEVQRAAILCSHLGRNNVVLILDDVWDKIDLVKLGVPHKDKGCKLILTTRLQDVCHWIGCDKLFKVDVFNEEGAWNLFKEVLVQDKDIVLTDAIEKHAKELAKKCGGLPLALKTLAASMRGVNDNHSWRNAIKNFRNGCPQMGDQLEKGVFDILQFSYNKLDREKWKKCFLYCCLYPEDDKIPKDEIIIKLIAEGLCEDRDEGHSILNHLEKVFLLEGGEWYNGIGYVKMHDLMREMALTISKFMVKSELTEIPEEKHWIAELERVSFMRSEIKEIPDDFSPRCPSLSTLILQGPYYMGFWQFQRIPESFLLYMRTQLRVLDLSYISGLECLPNSISDLENLYGLYLVGCERISCLPGMKKLKKLMVLNIDGCYGIRELPQDMGCLVNLQYLYMRHTSKYLEIPKGVIAKLRNLRCFHLHSCPNLQSEEVNCLTRLQEFANSYDDLHSFNNTTLVKKLEQLKYYRISVGCHYTELESEERSVCFRAINFEGKRGQEVKVLLPANICCLRIEDCDGLDGCILDNFQSLSNNLSKLSVYNSIEAEWIWDSEQIIENAATPFKCLEKLHLKNLQRLVSLFKGEDVIILPDCTFSSLKHLYVSGCNSMTKLLSQALLQNFQNLEILEVQFCENLEVVIGVGDEEGSSNTRQSSSSNISCLPKLKHLQLEMLPKLKSICNGREMVCPSIEVIRIFRCQNIKRMPSFLPIDEAQQPYLPSSFQNISLLKDEKEWWESLEWHNPNEKDILESHIEWRQW
ncbi:PREDICTED: probable disease resistance protein At4g27220 isoform X3 [Ipomoea nil]|uniref:probable disease resistance protein At4g27220 isoform X3 n=1 Tax=Ipomoea nil TaxID=35883 RepID=UPI000901015A|nr:PREDICTED: probable disease resistance protein At4g27220 isoform X3 [Ipomoea nil]